MKKSYLGILALISIISLALPMNARAAGGVYASGGGTKTVGQTFTVTVAASGATYNYIEGRISVSGPVSVVSFDVGSADVWMTRPSNGGSFAGAFLGRTVTSSNVATIKLKANSPGSGAVSVTGVSLKNNGSTVGSGAGNASFTIQKAPDLPGAITVTSASHPDQAASYEATSIALAWTKASNVTGFSYLLDQAANTTPPSVVTNANTSVTYDGKAVGTYYFHIKGQSADGWGAATHFKINIKEPDPKIDESLSKPHDIVISKSASYTNDITLGIYSGFVISGVTEPNFNANISLDPALTLPEGKILSIESDTEGKFELPIDFPVKPGHYKLTIQGQNEKILTPVSEPVIFEISQVKGGLINVLTISDEKEPVVEVKTEPVKKWYEELNYRLIAIILSPLFLISIVVNLILLIGNKRNMRNLARSIHINNE